MVTTPNFDLDVDTTLGGNNASDYIIPSQKAIKSYVDNNSGGSGTVDQTYDSTSANAQSGVAIAGAGFLKNEATQSGSSITLQGTTKNKTYAINIGVNGIVYDYCTVVGATATTGGNYSTSIGYYARSSGTYSTALGNGTYANAQYSLALGSGATTSQTNAMAVGTGSLASGTRATALGSGATASGNYAIQLGYGTNNTANTLNVGFYNSTNTHYNWQLLDGTTGLIPDDRISSNIARTSAIPTVPTNVSAFTNDAGYLTSIPSGYVQNTATGSNSLSILGSATTNSYAVNIGTSASVAADGGTAIGYDADVSTLAPYGTAIGYNANASKMSSIQIGYGTNSTDNTLNVGFYNTSSTHYNWQLLDGTTGLIPDARISTNIARTSSVADNTLSNVSSIDSSSAVATALDGKADTNLSNLSATGKTVLDGQWVTLNQTVVTEGTSLRASTNLPATVNVPNDGHIYEVLFRGNVTTGSSSSNYVRLWISTNQAPTTFLCGARTRTNSTMFATGSCIAYMTYATNNLTVYRQSDYNGTAQLDAVAYRRVGTNT